MSQVKAVGKELLRRMTLHNVTVTSAGIAFYGLLALVPTLTALVAIYGLVADPAEIESQIADTTESLSENAAATVTEMLEGIVNEVKGSATVVLIGSILIALFSASGAVQKLLGAVKMAYDHEDDRPGWQVRIGSYLFTAAAIIFVAILASLISVVPQLLDLVDVGGSAETTIGIVRLPMVAMLFMGALTVIYRYGPGRKPRTPWINPGAFVGGGLFILSAIGLSIYTSSIGSLPASYSVLGSVAAIMIFLQLAALSVIIGAEVNGIVESTADEPAVAHRQPVVVEPAEPVSFAKAMAGVATLVLLGRGGNSGNDG
jgi:membrane protein